MDAAGDLDGIPRTAAGPPPAAPCAHPNGITRVDHIVVMTPDLDRTMAALATAGLGLRRVRETSLGGSPHRQAFYWAGASILEVVGPAEATGDGPARLWGLALEATDLVATATWLGDRCGPIRDAVQPGRRIATIRTRELGISTPLSILSPHPQRHRR